MPNTLPRVVTDEYRPGQPIVRSVIFPEFVQATTTTPSGQPCYVPFVSRPDKDHTCIFVMNTPDVPTGPFVSKPQVLAACRAALLLSLLGVNRLNDNMFAAIFASYIHHCQAGLDGS